MKQTNATKTAKNATTTAIAVTKTAITTADNGDMTITTNGISTTVTAKGNGIATAAITKDFISHVDGYTLREDLKSKPIGKHIANINRYMNGIKTAVLNIGKELAEISADKSYTDLGFKSFERFYTDYLGMKKATVYQNINCYLMCCDIFGNVKIDFDKAGDVNANKALRIGMTPDDFQKTIDYADKNDIKITSDNITEIADKAGAKYDKDKATKDAPKKSKKVTVLPELKDGYFRFISADKQYIDIPTDTYKEYGKEPFNKYVENILNDGLNAKTDSDKMVKVTAIRLNGQWIVVTATAKGVVKNYVLLRTAAKKK